MIFGKKKDMQKCEECGNYSEKAFSFCPYCGNDLIDRQKEKQDYGMLGRQDAVNEDNLMQNLGFTDKIFMSVFSSLMKNLDKQFQNMNKEMMQNEKTEIRALPNGIRIKISPMQMAPQYEVKQKKTVKRKIDEEQMRRISSLPRAKAKSKMKRLGDKVIYEFATPGVGSLEDIFISKLENGYEIKAIGGKKIYVNSIPVEMPIKKYSVGKDKVSVEFMTNADFE
jgi:predicted RNA-binding Zn-ribbon protein involved in translation (DUF1610 family)